MKQDVGSLSELNGQRWQGQRLSLTIEDKVRQMFYTIGHKVRQMLVIILRPSLVVISVLQSTHSVFV